MSTNGSRCRQCRGSKFVLNQNAKIIRDLHDCSTVLEWLKAGHGIRQLPHGLRKRRYDFLIVPDHRDLMQIRNFKLGRGTADALEFFRRPRSEAEFIRKYKSSIENTSECFEWFRDIALDAADKEYVHTLTQGAHLCQ